MASSIVTNPGGLSTYKTNAYVASEANIGGTGRKRVKEIRVRNLSTTGATRLFMVFDSLTVPADGAAPALMPLPVVPGANVSVTYPSDNEGRFSEGEYFATGVSWCSSSTETTKTLAGSDLWVEISFAAAL